MGEILYGDPQNSEWWMSRLIWLLDYKPDLIREMWNSPNHEKLLSDLDAAAIHALNLYKMLDEMPEDARQEMIAEAICPSEMDFPDEDTPEEMREEILSWAENLIESAAETEDGRTVKINVP